jgi:signal transduction histidine kinase
MLRRLQATDPRLRDWALATVLALYAQYDVWVAGAEPGPRWLTAVGVALLALPLGLRRRFPLGALVVALGGFAVAAALADSAPEGALVLLPALLWLYSVAAHSPQQRALAGLTVVGVAVGWSSANDSRLVSVGDVVLVDAFFFGLLGMAAWLAGRYVRRRRRQAASLEHERDVAVVEERARIARELHDVVAHAVSVMGVQAAAGEQVLGSDPERAREPLQAIQATAREAILELRRLLDVLRETPGDDGISPPPGLAALGPLVDQARDGGLAVELVLGGSGPPPGPGVELSAFRIVQEALTNARRHAHAAHVRVEVRCEPRAVELTVEDDGAGPAATPNGAGHGLAGMRERVALFGGTLETGPGAAGGFRVRARLPVQERR